MSEKPENGSGLGGNPVLFYLIWVVRAYYYLVIAWAIMTWIPGLAGSLLHDVVGWPIVPLLNLLSFARIGFVGLQAVILLVLLWMLLIYLERMRKGRQG
ncbi:hypothetical protein IIA79_08430 [bacterium]|nr:hypothetical protein [bacterium]